MEIMELSAENDEPESKVYGLTGGIGSGKSTVAKMLEEAGFAVYFSDERAKNLVHELPALKPQITMLLGNGAYNKQGLYDRKYVAGVVFENPEKLAALNAIIHPAVREDFLLWLKLHKDAEIVFKETALLFELGLDAECKKTLLVTADDNARIKRVMDRDGKTYREVLSVMERQMPEKDKIRRADFVVYNNGTLPELELEVAQIIEQLAFV